MPISLPARAKRDRTAISSEKAADASGSRPSKKPALIDLVDEPDNAVSSHVSDKTAGLLDVKPSVSTKVNNEAAKKGQLAEETIAEARRKAQAEAKKKELSDKAQAEAGKEKELQNRAQSGADPSSGVQDAVVSNVANSPLVGDTSRPNLAASKEVNASGVPQSTPAASTAPPPEQVNMEKDRNSEVPIEKEAPLSSSQVSAATPPPARPVVNAKVYDQLLARYGDEPVDLVRSLRGSEVPLPPLPKMIFKEEYKRVADDLVRACHSLNALASRAESSYTSWAEDISTDSKRLVEQLTDSHEKELRLVEAERDMSLATLLAAKEELSKKDKELDILKDSLKAMELKAKDFEKEQKRLESLLKVETGSASKAKAAEAKEKKNAAKAKAELDSARKELDSARKEAGSALSSLKDFKKMAKAKWERRNKAFKAELKAVEAASNLSMLEVVKTGKLDMEAEIKILTEQEAEGKKEYEDVSDPDFS